MGRVPIHHLNCASFNPLGGPRMVAHVLLVERDEGLLLVDTGFGTADLASPKRLGRPFLAVVRPALDPGEPAVAQLAGLGFSAEDVTDIALTHLDLDHVGGIGDFPHARIHVFDKELEAATHRKLAERGRYQPKQWAHGPQWVRHHEAGDPWFGFETVTALGDDVLLVPLLGHTRGHCGVAVKRPKGGWLFHAGDTFFDAAQIAAEPSCNGFLKGFQRFAAIDNKRRLANSERVRELTLGHPDEVTVFCAHDASQYDALAGRPVG